MGEEYTINWDIVGIYITILIAAIFYAATKYHSNNTLIKRTQLQLNSDLKKQRNETFMKKRIEKASAIIDKMNTYITFLENDMIATIGYNEMSENHKHLSEATKNANSCLTSELLNELILGIMTLEESPKRFDEYHEKYIENNIIGLNHLHMLIRRRRKYYFNKLEKIGDRVSGWSLFITDKKIVKRVDDLTDKIDQMDLLRRQERFEELKPEIEIFIKGTTKLIKMTTAHILEEVEY